MIMQFIDASIREFKAVIEFGAKKDSGAQFFNKYFAGQHQFKYSYYTYTKDIDVRTGDHFPPITRPGFVPTLETVHSMSADTLRQNSLRHIEG